MDQTRCDQPTTTTQKTTTDGPVTTTTKEQTTKDPDTEDPDFCKGKKDGLYAHPDCSKYYSCYHSGSQIVYQCATGTLWSTALGLGLAHLFWIEKK